MELLLSYLFQALGVSQLGAMSGLGYVLALLVSSVLQHKVLLPGEPIRGLSPTSSITGVTRSAAWDAAHSSLSQPISLWPTKHKV